MADQEKNGVFEYTDEEGNKVKLYPNTKTDTTLTEEGTPADAAAVGEALGNVIATHGYGNVIFDSDDINTWTSAGCYFANSSTTNIPEGGDGWGTVIILSGESGATTRLIQLYHLWNNGLVIFYRVLNDTTWSDWNELVNLNSSQALTNKTYNGYTLAAACARGVDTAATSGSTNLITSGAMYTALASKASLGSTAYFAGVFLGSATNATPYIYTENNNINFRYVDSNGNTNYNNVRQMVEQISAKLPLSGGTMTGILAMNHQYLYLGRSGTSGFICSRNAANQIGIGAYYGGTLREALLLQLSSASAGQFFPGVDASFNLGISSYRWQAVYSGTSTIVTSDRTKKKEIVDLDDVETTEFIMGLKPSSYKFIDGTSDRTHYGLIAQDVEELLDTLNMDSKDFAGFIKSPRQIMVEKTLEDGTTTSELEEVPDEYDYSLRYEEFIAPLIKMVQMQQNEIQSLKEEIAAIKSSL